MTPAERREFRLAAAERQQANVSAVRAAARSKLGLTELALFDGFTEQRMLVGMLVEREAFERSWALGVDDFHDYRAMAVLRGIRALPNRFEAVRFDEVVSAMETHDAERLALTGDKHFTAQHGFWYLCDGLANAPAYHGAIDLIEHDVAWLQELARRRAQIARCA